MKRPIRTLLFSTLYPSASRPVHGIFVETRLRELLKTGEVETKVLAPVPWFPSKNPRFGDYARFAATPRQEQRHAIEVFHPRYFLPPKIGMHLAPYTLALSAMPLVRQLLREGFDFDLIDAHYFYPDGVAATLIGQAIKKPVVVTARGSDINLVGQYQRPRRMMVDAGKTAAGIIAVSSALKNAMSGLGIDKNKISVLGNGVDLSLFYPEDRAAARAQWNVSGFVIASVGNLIPTKGHDLVIRALVDIPDAHLLIAGQGPEQHSLIALAASLGVGNRVQMLGAVSQATLRAVYSAADCLVLASVREGWPNVLLEAMACGAPVIASNVGGVPEIIAESPCGVLLENRTPSDITNSIRILREAQPSRVAAQAHASKHSWEATTQGQLSLFRRAKGFSDA